MPPIIAAPLDVWEVVLEGRHEEQQVMNVLYFQSANGSTDVETKLIRALITCFLVNLVPAMSPNYEFVRAVGKQVAPILGPMVEVFNDTANSVDGGATGDSEPSYVSALISIHTTRGGRAGRGRIFIPAVPESGTINSFLSEDAAFWTALLAFVLCVTTEFLKDDEVLPADTWRFGVLSRSSGNPKPPFLVNQFAPATRLVPKTALCTTRSRKVGKGS